MSLLYGPANKNNQSFTYCKTTIITRIAKSLGEILTNSTLQNNYK